MKPNIKCIKAVLLYVQDNTSPSKRYISLNELVANLSNFTKDQIVDTLQKMEHEDIFTVFAMDDFGNVGKFGDLTNNGYNLANQLRNAAIWKKVLKAGISSIPALIKFIFPA